jgi:hypothetical protein
MKRRHFLLSGTASAAVALTGCGGGSDPSGSASSSTSTATPSSAAAATSVRARIAAASGSGVGYPFGSRISAYVAGTKPSQSTSAMDSMLTQQYDGWKAARVVSANQVVAGGYAIQFSNPTYLTVSEGMGYGMLLAVLFAGHDPNAQQLFDGLLSVARTRNAYGVAQYDPNGKYLMDWELFADGTSAGGGWSACDGDLDIAMSLLMADQQWGSGGTWNYRQEALNTIAALKSWNFDQATGSVGGRGVSHPGSARVSDYMIGHFRAFRAATGDTFWDMAIAKNLATLDYLQTTYSPSAGLLPDWAVNVTTTTPAPSPGFIGDGIAQEGDYWWNSCRDPWRLASDYLLSGDANTKTVCGRMVQFFQSQVAAAGGDVTVIGTGYSLDGTKLTGGTSPSYHGPIMLGACIDSSYQAFLDAMWNWNASHLTTGYYDCEIQLLSMVVASGNWWTPGAANAGSGTSSSSTSTGTQQPTTPQTTTTATAAAGGLLVNGDFANGLTGWNNWGNSQVVAGVLQVGTGAGGVAQDIASKLTAGTSYQLSGTAYLSAPGEGVFVGVKLLDASGNVLMNEVKSANNMSPASGSITFTVPAGVATAYVYVWKNANAAVGMVQNLSLAQASSAAAAGGTSSSTGSGNNLLANGDFSQGLSGWNNWGNSQAIGGAVNVGTGAGGVAQDILSKLVPGKSYQLTGLAGVTAPSEGVFVGVRIMDASGTMLVNQTQLVSAMSATNVSVAFTAPANAATGYVFVWKNANAATGLAGKLVLSAA